MDALLKTIITTLAVADPSAADLLTGRIEYFWVFEQPYSCGDPALQYWRTRRKAIQHLMGCYAKQVDMAEGQSTRNASGHSSSRQDSHAEAQATNQSTRWADSVATSRYNDKSSSRQDSGSKRDRSSSAYSHSRSKYDDTGFGASRRTTFSRRDAEGIHRVVSTASQDTAVPMAANKRYGGDWAYTYSSQERKGSSGLLWGTTETQTRSGASQGSCFGRNSNTTTLGDEISQTRTHRTDKARAGRTSSSFFNALVDSHASGESGSRMDDNSSSFRDVRAHADGLGNSQSASRSKAEGSGQGTAKSHGDGEAHRESGGSSQSTNDSMKLHQRFKHLTMLSENARQMIDHLMKLRAARMGYKLVDMVTTTMDGYCCAAERMVISTPCDTQGCYVR